MPGLPLDTLLIGDDGSRSFSKEKCSHQVSPRSPLSPHTPRCDSIDLAMDDVLATSIEQLYHNVCEMQSSDHSPSGPSFLSYGEESRIDSELCHLVGSFRELELAKVVANRVEEEEEGGGNDDGSKKVFDEMPQRSSVKTPSPKSNSKLPQQTNKIKNRSPKQSNGVPSAASKPKNAAIGLDTPKLGPFLLKQTRDLLSSGENPRKALEFAIRAVKCYEKFEEGNPSLELVMSLHFLASIYCKLGKFEAAIPILERSIEIPVLEQGGTHALAKFAGCMQLGDTYAMLGQLENSILLYTAGLEIQKQCLGDTDSRVGETCRYLAEAHLQALQFDEAEKLCQTALNIHKENGSIASPSEAVDRRLMGLICDLKGSYESSLEHYALASMAMASSGNELDVAFVDRSIGDSYLAMSRYDEAVCAYQKALTVFKSAKGETHPWVGSVLIRLADLYNKTGKFKEAKSLCGNALKIYAKLNPGTPKEEIAGGLIEVAAIYQSMNELDRALKLLKKALRVYGNAPGQQSSAAAVEAQMGVMFYMMGNFDDSYETLKASILKFRACGEKKSGLFGIALNQMGLTCVQRYAINEAAELFEEARDILENEYGPYHPDTLGVYSNLAGTYDAMGRYLG